MKDAFGSTFLIGLMMVFVIIFVSFTAVIANIAKTFRIKNQVINYVEQYDYGKAGSQAIKKIDTYLGNASYQRVDGNKAPDFLRSKCESSGAWYESYGYCIVPFVDDEGKPKYFKVTVYATVSLPFFDISLSLPISGETQSVVSLN